MSEEPSELTESPDRLAGMPLWKVLFTIGLQAMFFTIAGVAIFRQTERPIADFVVLDWSAIVNGVALALVLMLLSMVLSRLFPAYARRLIQAQARTYGFLANRVSMPAILFISLCAGIGEEALFRGGLQTLLGDYMPAGLALALAAAAFALIHFAKPHVSALLFIIGCLFGWIYWQTGSLLTVMIAHALYDVYALWALQKAMGEMGLLMPRPAAHLPGCPGRETLQTDRDTRGEDQ